MWRLKMEWIGGAVIGACIALLAVNFLYGAQYPMRTARTFNPDVYYVVGEKRFDWFRKDGPNYGGGHTWDGRRISAVYVFGRDSTNESESKFRTPCPTGSHERGRDDFRCVKD